MWVASFLEFLFLFVYGGGFYRRRGRAGWVWGRWELIFSLVVGLVFGVGFEDFNFLGVYRYACVLFLVYLVFRVGWYLGVCFYMFFRR